MIARLHGKHWSAVITYRQQVIRLVSVCRAISCRMPKRGTPVVLSPDCSVPPPASITWWRRWRWEGYGSLDGDIRSPSSPSARPTRTRPAQLSRDRS